MQRRLCAAILALEAIAFGLVTPVLISVEGLATGTGLFIGLGLLVACLLVAGLLRFPWAFWIGWAIQVAAVSLGFIVSAMFALGGIFFALWGAAWYLGRKIELERAQWEASGEYPGARPADGGAGTPH